MKILSKINIFIFLAVFLLIFSFGGCSRKASCYTEEEHIQRITERIEKKMKEGESQFIKGCDGYKVYPLYNEAEQMLYALVEVEPYGFLCVFIDDEKLISCFAEDSMYTYDSNVVSDDGDKCFSPYIGDDGSVWWEPCTKSEQEMMPEPDDEFQWVYDENGERIYYNHSPYFVTENINAKKYLFRVEETSDYIFAVKKGDKFLNLISNEEFDVKDDLSIKGQSTLYMPVFFNTGVL